MPRFTSCREAETCRELSFCFLLPLSINTFFPVILSFCHLLSSLFFLVAVCPKVTLSTVLAYPSLSPSILSSFHPSNECSQVSAVTALAQGIMVRNSLPAPLCWSGGPLMYKQKKNILCVCVCVCVYNCVKGGSHTTINRKITTGDWF